MDSESTEPSPAEPGLQPKGARSKVGVLVIALLFVAALLLVKFLTWSIRGGHRFPTLERTTVSGLLGGLVGGIAGAIAELFKSKRVGQTASRFTGIVAVLSLVFSGPILKEISRVLNPSEDLGDRLASLPEFRAFAAKANGDVKSGMTRATRHGLRRLDDETLASRLVLMSKMEAKSDAHRCAALERGTATGDDSSALIGNLSTDEQKQFYDITFRAAAADMKGAPRRRWLSQQRRDEFHAALRRLLEKQPNGKRALAALEDPASAGDAELCEASQEVYRIATSMPGNNGKDGYLILLDDGGGGHPLLESPRWLSLNDESLIARAEILAVLMVKADQTKCAALARDAASDEEVDAELERLPQSRDKWKELSRQLTTADGPARTVGEEEYQGFASAMRRQLKDQRFDSDAYSKPDSVSDAEACRAHSTFLLAALSLPAPLLGVAGRILAGAAPPSRP